jgi:hypothetical protein
MTPSQTSSEKINILMWHIYLMCTFTLFHNSHLTERQDTFASKNFITIFYIFV